MARFPHFIIIGGMKCATSTLHDQLAAQPGFFMTEPKEPNFFSNDEIYERGLNWYTDLFANADSGDLCGESSTHYTKLPTYPHTIERLQQYVPQAKFIYMMRHPIDRLVSHFVHEWTKRQVSTFDINAVLDDYPTLIEYSQYAMQLRPYLETFGSDRILPIFFERFCAYPQEELERVCEFLGYPHQPIWQDEAQQQNASSDRIRNHPVLEFVVHNSMLEALRRQMVPKSFRTWVRGQLTVKQKPTVSPENVERLKVIFDQDLEILGTWLGVDITCDTFKSVARQQPYTWTKAANLVLASA
ncbi:MAG: sulfotransferase family protein [Thainema sp.]